MQRIKTVAGAGQVCSVASCFSQLAPLLALTMQWVAQARKAKRRPLENPLARWTNIEQRAQLKVEVARSLRLVKHFPDLNPAGPIRNSPVDGVPLLITKDGGA